MTDKGAFVPVPPGTTITIPPVNCTNASPDESVQVYIGCSRDQCHKCSQAKETMLNRGGQFVCVSSPGIIQTYGPGNKLTVTKVHEPTSSPEDKLLSREICEREHCQECRGIDFSSLLTDEEVELALPLSARQLIESAKSCPLCGLLSLSLVDPPTFVSDDTRPVLLRSKGDQGGIEISFPSRETGHEEMVSERCAKLHVYANTNSPLPLGNFARRLPLNPEDSSIAHEWLVKCMKTHEKCRKTPISNSQKRLPSRLINVGPSNGSQDPRLEEGQKCQGEYLTLSHRWGDPSTITKTLKGTLLRFEEQIPFKSLSRVFQDAIKITRSLNIKYIWIDSLCIIQDSPADQVAEISRMAEIYENALLCLSASISTSNASALFTSRKMKNLVKIPKTTPSEGDFASSASFITNQTLSSFSNDVLNGTLGSRGWCFQERLLSPRILHFGRNQLHWECHEGIWSESSTKLQWYGDFGSIDDGELRMALQSHVVFSPPPYSTTTGPLGKNATERAAEEWDKMVTSALAQPPPALPTNDDKRKMYDEWYKAVSAYTNRELTHPTDKLPAFAGAASRFKALLKDGYGAGLWGGDLPQGLLWSRRAFTAVKLDPSAARRPGVGGWGEMSGEANKGWRGAPSWSWASVDGAVHWVRERNGPVHIGPYGLMTKPGSSGPYAGLEWGAIRVRGPLAEIEQLSWLREAARKPEKRWASEKWLAYLPESFRPQLDPDDPSWEKALASAGSSRPLYFLLICSIPQASAPGQEGMVPIYFFGYALMLRYWPAESAFRRVGIARVVLKDFQKVVPADIDIL